MTLETLLRAGYKACTALLWPGGTQHFNEGVLIITKMVEKFLAGKESSMSDQSCIMPFM